MTNNPGRLVSRAPGILLLLLVACQPALTPIARPTPAVLTVQSTPALQPLGETFRDCVQEMGNTGLVLLDMPAGSLDPSQEGVAMRWGPANADKHFAAVVGQEELAVVAHPQNPVNSISLADLQAIYHGKMVDWPQSSPPAEILPWGYLPGDDAQAVFESGVLNGQPPSARVVHLAPDPAAMRDTIAASPTGIGFLPRRWLNRSVKELPVEGLDPASLRQPILALSKAEPYGMEKSWLICLQERLSE